MDHIVKSRIYLWSICLEGYQDTLGLFERQTVLQVGVMEERLTFGMNAWLGHTPLKFFFITMVSEPD